MNVFTNKLTEQTNLNDINTICLFHLIKRTVNSLKEKKPKKNKKTTNMAANKDYEFHELNPQPSMKTVNLQ